MKKKYIMPMIRIQIYIKYKKAICTTVKKFCRPRMGKEN